MVKTDPAVAPPQTLASIPLRCANRPCYIGCGATLAQKGGDAMTVLLPRWFAVHGPVTVKDGTLTFQSGGWLHPYTAEQAMVTAAS